MIRHLVVGVAAALALGPSLAPAAAAPDTRSSEAQGTPDGDDRRWHPVDEEWQPYREGVLMLPAEQYCGDFDLRLEAMFQDISSRVVSRWDSGGARETAYSGPLVTEATNTETGESVEVDLSGYARTRQRESGSLAVYESLGPVGMGFPAGSRGLPQGYYVLDGQHVVRFPEDGPRRLVVDRGPERNLCEAVD